MLGIGLVISELTSRLQAQLQASQQQERRTAQLFRMTRQLSELSGSEFLLRTAGRQLEEIFDGEVVLYLTRADGGSLSLRFGENDVDRRAAGQRGRRPMGGAERQGGRRRHRHAAQRDGAVRAARRFAANRRRARRAAEGCERASSIPSSGGCWKRAPA